MPQPIKRILISQPKPVSGNSPYYGITKKYGVTIDFRQFIQVVTLEAPEFRKQKVNIASFPAIIFTSRTAITHFFDLVKAMRLNVSQEVRYFCLTESVALYLQKFITYRKRRVSFGTDGSIESMIAAIHKHEQDRYLVPVAEDRSSELADKLRAEEIDFQEAVMFRTQSRMFDKKKETIADYDAVVFFSPKGITSLFDNYPDFKQGDCHIIASGPQTAKAIEEAGLRLDLNLAEGGVGMSLVEVLDQYVSEHL